MDPEAKSLLSKPARNKQEAAAIWELLTKPGTTYDVMQEMYTLFAPNHDHVSNNYKI